MVAEASQAKEIVQKRFCCSFHLQTPDGDREGTLAVLAVTYRNTPNKYAVKIKVPFCDLENITRHPFPTPEDQVLKVNLVCMSPI